MNNKIQLIEIVTKSRNILFHFVNVCNKYYRSGHDLTLYRKIIKLHREINNINSLLNDEKFHKLIYETLEKWNMNQRGAKLTTFDNFSKSISGHNSQFIELYQYKLSSITDQHRPNLLQSLEKIFMKLDVMKSKRRIVGVSKALHFSLPDLVMPVDSKYTMNYFYGYNKYSDNPEKEFEVFKDIFYKTYNIAKKLNLKEKDVSGMGWNTSIPKLIDNAMIGFNRYLEDSTVEEVMSLLKEIAEKDEIKFEQTDYSEILQKQKNKLESSKIQRIKEKLLIEKATKAGITVSEEEINAYMAERQI